MSGDIITQVSPESAYAGVVGNSSVEGSIDYNTKIHLRLRTQDFTITRDELMSLPESILLCLFPNGVFLDTEGRIITNLSEEDVVYVAFDPECFQYILASFRSAHADLLDMATISPVTSLSGFLSRSQLENVLQNKPAIIVLREDLDFYVIPPVSGISADQMRHLKIQTSQNLLQNKSVFSGLGYDVDAIPGSEQKLGPAEQHLFEMLCSSGFSPLEIWGNKSIEPSKCVILSLLLVRLGSNTPNEASPPDSPGLNPVTSTSSIQSRKSRSRIATLASNASRAASRSLSKSKKKVDPNQTKLLLFWRKPARKCWWSHQTTTIELDKNVFPDAQEKTMEIKVHTRRVWTLELSVIGVQ